MRLALFEQHLVDAHDGYDHIFLVLDRSACVFDHVVKAESVHIKRLVQPLYLIFRKALSCQALIVQAVA